MSPINVLIKPASGMCNMSCDYCFYCDEIKKRENYVQGVMTEVTLKNVIRKTMFRADNMISYAFQGGEPTLAGLDFFKRAVEYQTHYNKNDVKVLNSIQTNGYSLNDKWCEFLKQNQFLVGLSVDGTQEIHDSLRHNKIGAGTYKRIMQSVEMLDFYGVEYNILTVVTPEIVRNIENIYTEYQRRGWKHQQYIACLDPLGEEHRGKKYSLSPELYGDFLIRLYHLWKKDLKKGKHPYIRQFENYVGIAAGYFAEACDQRGVCGIQNVVEADGSVFPCDFYVLDKYCLGNFNKNHLGEIDIKRSEIGFIERSYRLSKECRECDYYKLCRGGCQRNRDWNSLSDVYENYFCAGYKKFFSECYDQFIELGRGIL